MDKKVVSSKTSQLLKTLALTESKEAVKEDQNKSRLVEKGVQKIEKQSQIIALSLNLKDRQKIREVSMWFAAQGIKVSDSMIVRCALRMITPNKGLIDIYHQARALDQRVKKA